MNKNTFLKLKEAILKQPLLSKKRDSFYCWIILLYMMSVNKYSATLFIGNEAMVKVLRCLCFSEGVK